jgi:ankyrin repeat protein
MTHRHPAIEAVILVLLIGALGHVRVQPPVAPSDKADALSEAARKGDAVAVKQLLDEGVDVNTKFRYNRTALSFAADRGHVDVVKLLLDRGADVNTEDTFYHATALTLAVNPAMDRTPRHADVVRLLLQHGAKGKEDALMGAVSAGDAPMTKVVLEAGGLSANTLSDALEAATARKRTEIAAILEQAGAKPYAEVKLDAAQLARYVGKYRDGPQFPNDLVVAITDGRLTATPGGPLMTLVARDQTTFAIREQPGAKMTFKVEQDKATSVTLTAMGNSITFMRIE